MNGRAWSLRKNAMKLYDISKKPKEKALMVQWYKDNAETVSRYLVFVCAQHVPRLIFVCFLLLFKLMRSIKFFVVAYLGEPYARRVCV